MTRAEDLTLGPVDRTQREPQDAILPTPVAYAVRPGGSVGAHRGDEIRIELGGEEEMFSSPPVAALLCGGGRLRCGMEELLNELAGCRPRTVGRVTIVLPGDRIGPDAQRRLAEAVGRYCRLRLRETENELRATLRDTRRALAVGMIVLVAGLALSGAVLASGLPHAIRTLFGDGLFVVMAWVGAWYPLDVFIHQTRPQRQTLQLLSAAAQLEIVVTPAGH